MTTVNADVRPSIPVPAVAAEPAPPSSAQSHALAEPVSRRWSRDEYYRLLELGFFEDRKVELIEGMIVQMPAQSNLHAIVLDQVAEVLRSVFGSEYWIRAQFTVDLSDVSSPDPDVAVVPGSRAQWAKSKENPTTALLMVEVSVTTGPYDKGSKASLYAKAGIADYWVIDVPNKQLQVRRKPAADETQPLGFGYLDLTTLESSDVVSPLALPEAKITVGDLLPA